MDERQQERDLVRRMLGGEEAAFDEFSEDYIPALYRHVLFRLGQDRELTKEIVQTTLCKAISKLDTFRGEAALMTWLCACSRNEIAMHFRRKSRRIQEVELSPETTPTEILWKDGSEDGPERRVLRLERSEMVHRVLDSLAPHYGRALEWKYLEDLSVREIARRLDLGPKAAESLLTRARNAFREAYERLRSKTEVAAAPRQTA